MAVDVKTGEERMLLENVRIGEIVFNPADRSLWGVRHDERAGDVGAHSPPLRSLVRGTRSFRTNTCPTISTSRPTGGCLSASVSEVNGDQFLRVWEIEKLQAGRFETLSRVPLRAIGPGEFRVFRDGRYLYGSSYYTGVSNIFRYDVATGAIEAVSNAESGFFRPVPLTDGRLAGA